MKWMEKFSSGKKEQIVILLLAGILLLVIAIPADTGNVAGQGSETGITALPEQPPKPQSLESRLEEKLRQILAQVEGVGNCEVMITLKSEGRRIVEKDQEQKEGREERPGDGTAGVSVQAESSESTVYQKDSGGNEIPYVSEQLSPEISGVLVIAQGGENAVTVNGITEAVMALFGIEAHKIKVMKME